ncbi:MAG: FAD-dependent oxidoreductase [Pseudomonadota bacterium]
MFDALWDVAIVGGGPSGLALATALKHQGVDKVVVLEREVSAGGVPRHCGHYPFGIVEFHRLMKGPAYAERHVACARAAGVVIATAATVLAITPGGQLHVTSDEGVGTLSARRIALCTGAREASRAQRFIGGPRQRGVVTTGALQSLVYLEGLTPFRRPVILGTELVSFSSILTCRHAGIKPVAMVEPTPKLVARAFAGGLPALLGIEVVLGAQVRRIVGNAQVEGVEITTHDGKTRTLEADGVICTGAFRPEAALMRCGHIAVDDATGGPVIDQYGRSSDPAVFCAGNLLRPIETSAWCAREGQEAAQRIAGDLAAGHTAHQPVQTSLQIAHEAISYCVPQRLSRGGAGGAMTHAQIRLSRPARGRLHATVAGRSVWSMKVNSRPERRILAPLEPITRFADAGPIKMTFEER